MNYNQISKETFDLLYKSRASLNNSPVSPTIRGLEPVCDFLKSMDASIARQKILLGS